MIQSNLLLVAFADVSSVLHYTIELPVGKVSEPGNLCGTFWTNCCCCLFSFGGPEAFTLFGSLPLALTQMGSALSRFLGPGAHLYDTQNQGNLYTYDSVRGQTIRLAANAFRYTCRVKHAIVELLAGRVEYTVREDLRNLQQEVDQLQRTTFALFRAVSHTHLEIIASVEDIPVNEFETQNFNPEEWPQEFLELL